MRAKTLRLYRRIMGRYKVTFGFREPYQILVDASFCETALEQKVFINEELPKVLSAETAQFVTECTMREIRNSPDKYPKASMLAKRITLRRCPHTGKSLTSAQCIQEIIGDANVNHYCVATQDEGLRKSLRKLCGVPVLHMNRGIVVLEPMSDKTVDAVEEVKVKKLLPENEVNRLRNAKAIQPEDSEKPAKKKKKKKKEPNPLSVKKKKKPQPTQPKAKNPSATAGQKRKRSDDKKDNSESPRDNASHSQNTPKDTPVTSASADKPSFAEETANEPVSDNTPAAETQPKKKRRTRKKKTKHTE